MSEDRSSDVCPGCGASPDEECLPPELGEAMLEGFPMKRLALPERCGCGIVHMDADTKSALDAKHGAERMAAYAIQTWPEGQDSVVGLMLPGRRLPSVVGCPCAVMGRTLRWLIKHREAVQAIYAAADLVEIKAAAGVPVASSPIGEPS